jgi:hypothetical protein
VSYPDETPGSTLGGTVGGKVAKRVADAVVNTRQRMAPHQAQVAQKVLGDFTGHVSDELRGALAPLWRQLLDDPEVPDLVKPLLRNLANERGQAWAWIAGSATGAAFGGGLINLLSNALNPAIFKLIQAAPHNILSAEASAQLVARRLQYAWDPFYDASANGIDRKRFNALQQLTATRPGPSEIQDMINRDLVDTRRGVDMLINAGYTENDAGRLTALRHVLLSPEIAAQAWARSLLPAGRVDELADKAGMDREAATVFRGLAGEPPDTQSVLLAWRRGVIDEADVNRAIVQGPIRNEWIPVIKALQWLPLPVGEAADAVNQGHLSLAAAKRAARENGIKDADFDVIIQNAGLPPGPQEVLDWLNRGIITHSEALQALYESRIKNKWVPTYLESRHETMPPETIRLMYTRGAIGADDAIRRLMARGYSQTDAAVILDGAKAEKTQVARDLTQTQIRELYADRAVSRTEALGMLGDMGYEPDEAVLILEIADLARLRKFVNAATTRIRSAYVSGRIDEIEASALLDQLQVPTDQRDDFMQLWDIERATISKALTPAQVTQAVKRDLLTVTQGMARLIGQGYSDEDAYILLELAGAVPAK